MWLLLLLQLLLLDLSVHAANEPYTGIDWKTVAGCEEKREENFYVLGCNQVFYRCYDGKAYEYTCPSNLFFDPRRNRCNHWDKTNVCVNEAEYKNKLVRGIKPFDCTGREGSFEHPESPCDNVYYTCVHGRPVRQQCREEHVFDEKTNRCDFKHNVQSCKNVKSRKISGPIGPHPIHAFSDLSATSGIFPPAPPPFASSNNHDMFCLNRPDGAYSAGDCLNVFWKCSNGKAFQYSCPHDLIYNDYAKKCQKREDVPTCVDRETLRKNFDCSTKVDGHYEKDRCQPYFYSCVGGKTEVQECHTGLVFDSRISACDYPEACRSSHQTFFETPIAAADHGSINDRKSELGPSIPFPCAGGKDGLFSIQKCSNAYVQCLNGASYPMSCPAGLVFNDVSRHCDYLDACLSTVLGMGTPSDVGQHRGPLSFEKISLTTQLLCPQGRDGLLSHGPCSKTYAQCVNGTEYVMNCPVNLVFNGARAYCDYPESIGCPRISCTNVPNGPYAVGRCSAEYVSCWEGANTDSKCHGNLVFNPHNGQCDYRYNVPECHRMPRAAVEPAPPAPAPIQPVVNKPKPVPVVVGSTYCLGKMDGYYSDGCSTEYGACISGKYYKLRCPGILKFSQAMQRCEPETDVEECVNQCISRPDGIHQLGCQTKYLVCFSGNARMFNCPAGLVYHGPTTSCEHPSRVPECRSN
nr:Chitin binding protein domain containing protein [Haemonchus contortus]